MNVPTDRELRSLDPAATTMTADEQQRAAATLERIVATTPTAARREPGTPRPARRHRIRLALLPTGAVALVAGLVLVPGGNGGRAAYASWTATPSAVTDRDLESASAACRTRVYRFVDRAKAAVVLAERRGDHVALLYRTEDPDRSAACLVRNVPGSSEVEDVQVGAGGSDGPAPHAPARGFTQGAIFESQGASVTDGAAGSQVTHVTIHAGSLEVTATVANGRYAAWWPGRAFAPGSAPVGGGRDPRAPFLTYDLTLVDGTVLVDAQPSRPS